MSHLPLWMLAQLSEREGSFKFNCTNTDILISHGRESRERFSHLDQIPVPAGGVIFLHKNFTAVKWCPHFMRFGIWKPNWCICKRNMQAQDNSVQNQTFLLYKKICGCKYCLSNYKKRFKCTKMCFLSSRNIFSEQNSHTCLFFKCIHRSTKSINANHWLNLRTGLSLEPKKRANVQKMSFKLNFCFFFP